MRVVEHSEFGGPEVLTLVERPEPAPKQGRVAVRVRAAAVNPVDIYTRLGLVGALTRDRPLPYVLGWDFAGEVVADASGFHQGQRVAGMSYWFATGVGAYSEVISVEPDWLASVPADLDDITAGALPLNALTGSQAVDLLQVQPGQRVLVTGASGAVGGVVVQLAAAAGAYVVALASTGDEAYVSGLGAKDVLGRQGAADLVESVRRLFPQGVDAVVDAAALAPELIAAVRDGGRFVAVTDPTLPRAERGISPEKVDVHTDPAALAELLQQAATGRLSVRVAEALPLEQAAEAHRRVAAGGLRGKIVLTP